MDLSGFLVDFTVFLLVLENEDNSRRCWSDERFEKSWMRLRKG